MYIYTQPKQNLSTSSVITGQVQLQLSLGLADQHQQPEKMKRAKYHLSLAFLPLAIALLLPLAACVSVDSTKHGNKRSQVQDHKARRGDNVQWCIAKPSTDDVRLTTNIDFSCSQSGVDCQAIQPGGTCFLPNTPVSHASYAMNLFYKAAGENPWDCNFSGSGLIVTQDPSTGSCQYL